MNNWSPNICNKLNNGKPWKNSFLKSKIFVVFLLSLSPAGLLAQTLDVRNLGYCRNFSPVRIDPVGQTEFLEAEELESAIRGKNLEDSQRIIRSKLDSYLKNQSNKAQHYLCASLYLYLSYLEGKRNEKNNINLVIYAENAIRLLDRMGERETTRNGVGELKINIHDLFPRKDGYSLIKRSHEEVHYRAVLPLADKSHRLYEYFKNITNPKQRVQSRSISTHQHDLKYTDSNIDLGPGYFPAWDKIYFFGPSLFLDTPDLNLNAKIEIADDFLEKLGIQFPDKSRVLKLRELKIYPSWVSVQNLQLTQVDLLRRRTAYRQNCTVGDGVAGESSFCRILQAYLQVAPPPPEPDADHGEVVNEEDCTSTGNHLTNAKADNPDTNFVKFFRATSASININTISFSNAQDFIKLCNDSRVYVDFNHLYSFFRSNNSAIHYYTVDYQPANGGERVRGYVYSGYVRRIEND